MNLLIKSFLTLTVGAGLTSGVVAVTKHPQALGLLPTKHSASISPVTILKDGTVVFHARVPPAAIAADIRTAVRTQNIDLLNKLLVEHRFYVIPEGKD